MTTTRKRLVAKVAAGAGALALGFAGTVGVASMAFADTDPDPDPTPTFGTGNIDPTATGTLNIHKYAGVERVEKSGGVEQTITGKSPVAGVEFTLYPITDIDLLTNDGWAAANAAFGTGVCLPSPEVPGHTLGTGIVMDKTDANGLSVKSGLAIGAYLVCETDAPEVVEGKSAPFIFTVPMPNGEDGWNYNIHAYPKNDLKEGEASKEVDDETAVKEGDQVEWTVKSKNVNGPIDSFIMTDTLDANLSWLSPVGETITVHKADGTSEVATGWFGISGTGQTRTWTTNGTGVAAMNALPAGYYFTFTFETVVNGPGILENHANVNGQEVEASTPWGFISVLKVDKDNNELLLAGATFEVYAGECEPDTDADVLDTLTTDGNGVATSIALKDSTRGNPGTPYCLKETAVPAGYVMPTNVYTNVTVKAGETTPTVETILNTKAGGPELPTTGASGTMLMTVGGLGLVAVAGGLYLATRRKAHQK